MNTNCKYLECSQIYVCKLFLHNSRVEGVANHSTFFCFLFARVRSFCKCKSDKNKAEIELSVL